MIFTRLGIILLLILIRSAVVEMVNSNKAQPCWRISGERKTSGERKISGERRISGERKILWIWMSTSISSKFSLSNI
jgi:hypothetical protein